MPRKPNPPRAAAAPSATERLAALCREYNCRVEDLLGWKTYPEGRLVILLPSGAKISIPPDDPRRQP